MLNLSYLHMNLSYCTYGLIPSYVCTHSLKGGMICMAVKCLGACALTGAVHRSTSHGCFQLAIETFNMNTRAAWSILIDVQRTKCANWCWPVRQRMDDLLTVCIIIIWWGWVVCALLRVLDILTYWMKKCWPDVYRHPPVVSLFSMICCNWQLWNNFKSDVLVKALPV